MTATRKGVADATIQKRRKILTPIIKRVATEGISLRQAAADAGRPIGTVFDWLDADPSLAEQYARAKERRADHLHELMVRAATEPEEGEIRTEGSRDGKPFTEVKRHDAVERARLKVDTLKWVLGRMAPKRYGDTVKVEQTGAEGGPIVTVNVTANVDEALARLRSRFAP